jgi:hypothetical protein
MVSGSIILLRSSEDPLWNFVGEFPSRKHWDMRRATKISVEAHKEALLELIDEYEDDLRNELLIQKNMRYYIQSIRLTS